MLSPELTTLAVMDTSARQPMALLVHTKKVAHWASGLRLVTPQLAVQKLTVKLVTTVDKVPRLLAQKASGVKLASLTSSPVPLVSTERILAVLLNQTVSLVMLVRLALSKDLFRLLLIAMPALSV